MPQYQPQDLLTHMDVGESYLQHQAATAMQPDPETGGVQLTMTPEQPEKKKKDEYQPQDLLAHMPEKAAAEPAEGLIPQIREAGGIAPYLKEVGRAIGAIPLGAVHELAQYVPHQLASPLMQAYQDPEIQKTLREAPEPARLGRIAADIGPMMGATGIGGALGRGLLRATGREAGPIVSRLVPGAGRAIATGGITATAAPPGEKYAGALTGLGAGVGAEFITGGLAAAPKMVSRLGSLLSKAEPTAAETAGIVTDPEVLREAKARVQKAQQVGITGLPAGAITRIPEIQAKEEMLLKGAPEEVAKPLQLATEKVDQQINTAANKMVNALGGEEKTDLALGEDIQHIFRGTKDKTRTIVSNLYDIAADAPGGNILLPAKRIIDKYNQVNDEFIEVKFAPIVKKMINKLETQEREAQTLYMSPETGVPSKTLFDVKDANKLAKALNKSSRSATNPSDHLAISTLRKEVYDTIDDQFAGEVNPAAELFKMGRKARLNVGDVMDQKDIVELISRKRSKYTDFIAPEDVARRIFSSSNSVANLKKVQNALNFDLDPLGRKIINPQGQVAWDNLRRFKFNQLLQDSTNNVNGKPVLSYFKLIRNYKKINPKAMEMILGDKTLSNNFNKLLDVMEFYQNKAPGTINYSNTANVISRLARKAGRSMLTKIPLIGPMVDGIRSMIEHAQDSEWVMKNLKLAQMLKKNPNLADFVNPQETNPAISNKFAQILLRNSISSLPLMGQTREQPVAGQEPFMLQEAPRPGERAI